MGNTTKEELMEKVESANIFTRQEIKFINESIETHKELDYDIVLKLGTINEMEEKGILGRFYNICKENGFFPKWTENVESGKDHV